MIPKFGKYNVIVCGTRTFDDYELLKTSLDKLLVNLPKRITNIVSGRAAGADKLGERYALENGYKMVPFPADWKVFGKRAGMARNELMAQFGTHCIAFWDGVSPGTHDMINRAKKHELAVRVIRYGTKQDISG